MGNKSSTRSGEDYNQLLSNYEVLEKHQADNILLLRSKQTSRECLLREYTFNDKREFQSQIELLNKRKVQLHNCSHLMQLERIVSHSQDQFCSTHFKIEALYQWENRSLDDEINQRNLQKRKFQEKEIWSIAGSCIIALSHLQRQNVRHKALSSKAILLNEEGTVKLYDPLSVSAASNYETILAKRNTPHLYLSPEEVYALQAESNSYNSNGYKSDIWTLGMILLETGLCQYQDECYRDEWSRIHWETLQFNINKFKQVYSPELVRLIDLMLSREEEIRPDWIELEQRLLKNEESQRMSGRASHASNADKQKIYQQIIYSEPMRGSSVYQTTNRPNNQTYSVSFTKTNPVSAFPQPQIQPQPQPSNFVKLSIIDSSRPLRSLFPPPFYKTSTAADQNLIFVPDEYSEVSDTPNREDSYFNSLSKQRNESGRELKNKQASAKAFTPYVPTHNQQQSPEYVQERYRQGSQYRGYKWRGMRHGHGTFLYLDGGKYQGNWSFNKMEGRGCLYYQSGKLAYDGEWIDDQFSGRGVLHNESPQTLEESYAFQSLDQIQDFWVKYQGQFKADSKHGKGILYLTNGQSFRGNFVNDIAEGEAIFTTKQGRQIRGIWSNNKLIK